MLAEFACGLFEKAMHESGKGESDEGGPESVGELARNAGAGLSEGVPHDDEDDADGAEAVQGGIVRRQCFHDVRNGDRTFCGRGHRIHYVG